MSLIRNDNFRISSAAGAKHRHLGLTDRYAFVMKTYKKLDLV